MHRDGITAAYIMASRKNGTLYTGVTSDLSRRAFEHREGALPGFTKRYGVKRLVWYQTFELITAAIQRERTIKGYPRQWKINLIEAENPDWLDLYTRLNW
jgi:putative endonuclease